VILPYFLRLACLCLAAFFMLHTVLAWAAGLAAPAAIRLAETMAARTAARFLLFLRLMPVLLAVVFVLGVAVPSYTWLEPHAIRENVGFICLAAAFLGLAVWCVSITRTVRLTLKSQAYLHQGGGISRGISQEGLPVRANLLDVDAPVIALVGVFRPRIWISRSVMGVLSAEQLNAALRHENAHRVSRDNLKRLLFRLAPDPFPPALNLSGLERAWSRFSEWAADDDATGGDSNLSLSLAEALVRVARLGLPGSQPPVLATPLIAAGDLPVRVDRLLQEKTAAPKPPSRASAFLGILIIVTTLTLTMMQWPLILRAAHELLERLVS
jgi:hypothetical protein